MVMPLYDDNPFKLPHRPFVTWGLIVANILIYVAEIGATDSDALISGYGVTPAVFFGDQVAARGPGPLLTLLSYQFLHADLAHLFGNLLFLWVFGDNVEEALGRARFLAFYLACGVLGGLVFVVSDTHYVHPLIGASGSISGIVIAYVMLRPCAKVTVLTFGIIPMRISAYWVVGFFAFLQFINLGSASRSNVAYWCHIGGMAAGGVLFPLIRPAGVRLFECLRAQDQPVVTAGGDGTRGG